MSDPLPSPFPAPLLSLAREVIDKARTQRLMIATAESCTGGLIAALLTEVPGSSNVLERGYVTYSNEAKHELLGVPRVLFDTFGAVSKPVAAAMAEGAVARAQVDLAVSVTGVAGPDGGSDEKPVGLVWFGVAHDGDQASTLERRYGDLGRAGVRLAAVETALQLLNEELSS